MAGKWFSTLLVSLSILTAGSVLASGSVAVAQATKPIKIGIVTFLSGAAAGPFGIPAKNAAELFAAEVNAGKVPAPYAMKGIGGRPVELVVIDEAGGTTKQVSEYRNLVEQQGVDLVVGYISSGDCLAVAPVAEELKKFTLLFDCGTPRIFEDATYNYVFRPVGHAVMDNVGAALYISDIKPNLKKYAGINQNYAWGQDSWNDFEGSFKQLKPDSQLTTSQMPKLGAGQYNAEISAILTSGAEIVHSSFWGGDLEALILQGAPRNLFKNSIVILTAGETATHRQASQLPDGTVIGARGPNALFAPMNPFNSWFRDSFETKYMSAPSYPAYHMVQTLLAAKAAYEKAQGGEAAKVPSTDEIARALTGLTFDGPSGTVKMNLGNGHQATQEVVYGSVKQDGGKLLVVDIRRYPAEKVNPPDGVKADEWIKSGFKGQ
jgi:branched-chain amino acid transport system substrate-binding protein